MDKLVLFDIDGTLLESGNTLHRLAFSNAFKRVFNVDASIDIIKHTGKTDRQIIIEILKKKGIEESAVREKIEEIMKEIVDFFEDRVENENFVVLDGVRKLLKYLDDNKILMGLVTGNLEAVANGKMKRANLDNYFKVGGFGSDDENRANLVKMVIEKAENNFDFKFDNNVFLVGDTPRDILAGKEARVKTIAVATGDYTEDDLSKEKPDFILKDLTQKEEVLKLMKKKHN